MSLEPCKHCAGKDALTHTTEEHDEDYVAKLDPCPDCGAAGGEECDPKCEWHPSNRDNY